MQIEQEGRPSREERFTIADNAAMSGVLHFRKLG